MRLGWNHLNIEAASDGFELLHAVLSGNIAKGNRPGASTMKRKRRFDGSGAEMRILKNFQANPGRRERIFSRIVHQGFHQINCGDAHHHADG